MEVREEAAIGLRKCYVKAAAKEVRIRWYINEENDLVREALLDHFALFAHLDQGYEEIIVDTYQRAEFQEQHS